MAHTVTASQIMMHINCLGNWSNADSESLAGLRVCICDIFSVAAVPAILQAKLRKLSYSICHGISSVQFAQSCLTLCDSIDCSTPDLLVHHQLPEFTQLMSIELVMPSNHLILCRPLLLLPSIFPSIRVFSNESVLCIRWLKYWGFIFSISPSNEHSGLISFRMDWLDLLAVQGTLKSLLQHHSSKASILQCSAFSVVQLSHPHMTTGKTIALNRQTFFGFLICCLGWL